MFILESKVSLNLQSFTNLILRPQKTFSVYLEAVSAGELFNGKDEVGGRVYIVPWVTDCVSFFQLLSTTDNVLVFLIVISVTVILLEEQVLFIFNWASLALLPFHPSIFLLNSLLCPHMPTHSMWSREYTSILGKKRQKKSFPKPTCAYSSEIGWDITYKPAHLWKSARRWCFTECWIKLRKKISTNLNSKAAEKSYIAIFKENI